MSLSLDKITLVITSQSSTLEKYPVLLFNINSLEKEGEIEVERESLDINPPSFRV